MGQLITTFQAIPHFIDEVVNIIIMVMICLTLFKGIVNLCTCGLFQLIAFLVLAGRSCSIMLDQFNFTQFELEGSQFNLTMPTLCSKNDTHHYIKINNESGIEVALTNDSIVSHNYCNFTTSFREKHFDAVMFSIFSEFHLSIHKFNDYRMMSCNLKNGLTVQYNLSHFKSSESVNDAYCGTLPGRVMYAMSRLFAPQNTYSIGFKGKYGWCAKTTYKYLIFQNTTWEDHCKPHPLGYLKLMLMSQSNRVITRRLQAFFKWSLTDSIGNPTPGGYCLEKWMLVASELKCFGNTAIAKCNLNHDEEFCDMLSLIEYNKKALIHFKEDLKASIDVLKSTINGLISDQLLMRNHLRELMGIPYGNYTKFWYLNNSALNLHSLPKCWLVSNGSYLNKTEFKNDIEQEANNLLTEMLKKDYDRRQGTTPLGLMDMLLISTSFYITTVFLHLIKIPTHRHIVGKTCPKPHRLTSMAICSCGYFGQPGLKVKWKR
uniref:Glycoprotein n=1 Tax=Mecsek Mountains virus TaxID=3036599 RepID=A0A9Y1ZDT7_9VIRU|nr:glycoprotein precursor [Mecsek Mountains virus]